MIIQLLKNITNAEASQLATDIQAFHIVYEDENYLITGSGVKEIPSQLVGKAANNWVFANDLQLASSNFLPNKRSVQFGNVRIGGDTKNTVIIGGPCSVESEEQIRTSSTFINGLGLKVLRGTNQEQAHIVFKD